MMLDPDIPASTPGGPTGERLHWMQQGLVSANSTSTIAGRKVYQLINPGNVSAFAAYQQPTPPYKVPYSHRYVEVLLDTTNMPNNSVLATFAGNRSSFDAVKVINTAGVSVLLGNWFNVTNAQFLANGTGNGAASTTSTGGDTIATTSGARSVRWDAALGGIGVLVAFAGLL